MKTLKHLLLFVAFIISMTAYTQKDWVVGSDKSLEADFDKYKTYYWSSHAADADNLGFLTNDAVLKALLRGAIAYELDARGYLLDETNPDFLVNFRVFEDASEFRGYTGVKRDENYWGPNEIQKNPLSLKIDAETRQPENVRFYRFNNGTLLINFVDTETATLVWAGYVTGLMEGDVFDKDETRVKDAVKVIFEEYGYRADDKAKK